MAKSGSDAVPAASSESNFVKVAVCSAGIFVCYFWFSIAQHDIYQTQEDGTKFSHTPLQLFVMIFANTVGAVIANQLLGPMMGGTSLSHSAPVFSLKQITNPYSWLSIGLCFYGAMEASNRSLGSLPYPIMVLGKSCKMVPVMFSGMLINGTKYPFTKYISVFIITAGIVIVNLYSGRVKNADTATQVFPLLLLVLSLCLDAIVGPRQEHHRDTCKKNGTPLSPWETMFKTNLAGLLWSGVGCLLTNSFTDGAAYIAEHPAMWQPFATFAVCSVFGQIFIFYTIIKVSALACTTICTTRKFFTIVYTATMKGNALSPNQWFGAFLVMGGLVFDMVTKPSKKKQQKDTE